MPKNIVFLDDTGQEGGLREEQRLSDVYKFYRVCRVGTDSGIDPRDQVAFYDPGLGTDGSATGFIRAYRRLEELLSSMTGLGITKNLADCYEFIVNHYEPGDRIYLVGFSRGAYTDRCVANVLFLCGVSTTTPGGSGPAHPIVYERFKLADVTQCAGRGKYRPEALASHADFRASYVAAAAPPGAVRPGS